MRSIGSAAPVTLVPHNANQSPRERNESLEIQADGHLHRLGLTSLGWGAQIDARYGKKTGVAFIKPSRDRAIAIVPLRLCKRLLGDRYEKIEHAMNFSGFGGMSNVDWILDRIGVMGLTYLGEPVGAILYIDTLVELLSDLE